MNSPIKMRPLFAASIAEHEELMRSRARAISAQERLAEDLPHDAAFEAIKPDLEFGAQIGVAAQPLDTKGSLALEPGLVAGFPQRCSGRRRERHQSARGHARLCGAVRGARRRDPEGDARSLHRADGRWRVDTDEGPVDAAQAVVALGPWAPDVLEPLGIKLPLASSAAITAISSRAATRG